jgi:hypothetical protein
MSLVRVVAVPMLLACLLAPAVAPAASKSAAEEAFSADGLEKTKVKGIDLVYARPGASLAAYSKVRVAPVAVAFRKDFAPEKTGSRMKFSSGELEGIRADVGRIVHDEFVKELGKGSYAATDVAGPDVLDVRAGIADLYVNAPDSMQAGRTRTYTMNAGEMTLVMELADSVTGEVIARVYDRREARDTGMLTWTNSVTNQAEAANAARSWAKILRTRLDAARGIGRK